METLNGALIRELRKRRGITQLKLADLAGISDSYLSDIERGKITSPGLSISLNIAKALGVPLEDILEEAS